MINNPKVGQKVRLNNKGLELVGRLYSIEEARSVLQDTSIIEISEVLTNDGTDARLVTVDNPVLCQLMLTNYDFDAV